MRKGKVLRGGIFALAICLLLTVPTFAVSPNTNQGPGNGQNNGTGWSANQNQNGQAGQNGQGNQVGQSSDNNQSAKTSSENSDAVNYAAENGIIQGDNNGALNLTGNVKRGDMAIFLVRAFNLNSNAQGSNSNNSNSHNSNGNKNFSDVSSNEYYYDAVGTIKNYGIAQGDGTNYMPESYITLEEAMTLIERSMSKVDSSVIEGDEEELEELFSSRDLSDYATREDVINMLYYILTGNEPDENTSNNTDSSVSDIITYSVDSGDSVDFDGDDFADACDDACDETLSYVKFTLPSSSYGVLYYDDDTKVKSTTEYYADDDDSPAISDVSFTAKSSYSGTVKIAYKAYDDDDELLYSGVVAVKVSSSDADADTITYSVDSGDSVDFDGDDFADVCDDACDETLSYVKFTLPSSSYGVLYYDDDTKVKSTTKYYADDDDSPAISDVSFEAKSSYSGTVKIAYKAYDDDDELLYSGVVAVKVS